MRHTGARPGEATIISWCEIDAEADVWIYRPSRHKNEHRGKSRLIAIGPQTQQVLSEFGGSDTEYIFRPQESVDEYAASHCRSGAKARKVSAHYSVQSLRTAVRTACRKAGVDHWTPNQLRHNAGTKMRAKAGVDVAQIALGHSSVTATERYAEQNISAAADYRRLCAAAACAADGRRRVGMRPVTNHTEVLNASTSVVGSSAKTISRPSHDPSNVRESRDPVSGLVVSIRLGKKDLDFSKLLNDLLRSISFTRHFVPPHSGDQNLRVYHSISGRG